jgi:hypothetical protein
MQASCVLEGGEAQDKAKSHLEAIIKLRNDHKMNLRTAHNEL